MPGLVGSRLQTKHFYASCKLHSMFCCEKLSDCDRLRATIRKTPEVSAFSNQGQSLSYEELKHFQSQDPELADIIIEENSSELWSCLPRQSFPFFLPWNRSVNRTQILQEFFPTSSLLSFPKTVSLENCFLIRHPDLGNKSYSLHSLFVVGSGHLTLTVAPLDKCRGHCEMFKVDLEAGDLGYASMDYWMMSFVAKGTEPAVVCYGAAS